VLVLPRCVLVLAANILFGGAQEGELRANPAVITDAAR
jgi:hypothetical protein